MAQTLTKVILYALAVVIVIGVVGAVLWSSM